MIDIPFINCLKNCQSLSRTATDAMWNHWKWMIASWQLGIQSVDNYLVGCKLIDAESSKSEGSPESLPEMAMKRLKSGQAPPREIYDVRNRDQINWFEVPAWAKAPNPEDFEGSHEG